MIEADIRSVRLPDFEPVGARGDRILELLGIADVLLGEKIVSRDAPRADHADGYAGVDQPAVAKGRDLPLQKIGDVPHLAPLFHLADGRALRVQRVDPLSVMLARECRSGDSESTESGT
jgi:hypothetical protein